MHGNSIIEEYSPTQRAPLVGFAARKRSKLRSSEFRSRFLARQSQKGGKRQFA